MAEPRKATGADASAVADIMSEAQFVRKTYPIERIVEECEAGRVWLTEDDGGAVAIMLLKRKDWDTEGGTKCYSVPLIVTK